MNTRYMLIHNYYTILRQFSDGEDFVFAVSLNPDCAVYEGHFPGEPVSPGVCNIQMVKECVEAVIGRPLFLDDIQQCRFTTLITPMVFPEIDVRIHILQQDNARVKFRAILCKEATTCFELKAEASLQ